MLTKTHPQRAEELMKEAQEDVNEKWQEYGRLVEVYAPNKKEEEEKIMEKEKV
jgi:hypothetical protein